MTPVELTQLAENSAHQAATKAAALVKGELRLYVAEVSRQTGVEVERRVRSTFAETINNVSEMYRHWHEVVGDVLNLKHRLRTLETTKRPPSLPPPGAPKEANLEWDLGECSPTGSHMIFPIRNAVRSELALEKVKSKVAIVDWFRARASDIVNKAVLVAVAILVTYIITKGVHVVP